MVELAVIGDTHIPSRARRVPAWVRERVQAADHTVHVGDFDSRDAYEDVYEMAGGDLTAVAGNMDPRELGAPPTATVEFEGVSFVVTHGTGDPSGWERRVARAVHEEGGDVGLAGHTHQVTDETVEGVRLLNPGSATGAAPAVVESMLTITVEDGEIAVETAER